MTFPSPLLSYEVLQSERNPVMTQSDLLPMRVTVLPSVLVKLLHSSKQRGEKKEERNTAFTLHMKLCVLLYSTLCSPPLSWSSLNSLQLISNIPVQLTGRSSTLHRDNALPAPAQDCCVCVQVLHLLSVHPAQLGFCFQ